MQADELRAMQAPLKARYRDEPQRARITLSARGELGNPPLTCTVGTHEGRVVAGLHESVGGDGSTACAGTILLEALAACAGVTLSAVATAMGITVRRGTVRAEGELDVRGTLGVSKNVPVGFETIRLHFHLDTDADEDQLAKLVQLTERYCVVYQTLAKPPEIVTSVGTP